MQLASATRADWLPLALREFDAVLIDHAHCEKKAAANALSLLQAYPDVPGLPAQMARLAREESSHLAKVLALMEQRGLTLNRDDGDPYAKGLQTLVRTGFRERRLDRLLIAGIIESRSHERLQLLADALPEAPLRKLYAELARSEDGHQKLFVRLAEGVEPVETVHSRLAVLIEAEARVLSSVPLRPAIH